MSNKDKGNKGKDNTPAQKTLEGLLAMGVPRDQAEAVIRSTTAWLDQAQVEGKESQVDPNSNGTGDDGNKPFEEASTKPLDIIRDQGRTDLVKFVVETKKSDGIEKMAVTSEIPPPMIMRMVRALSVDELIDNKCKDAPAMVVALNFLLLMKAKNRSSIKELVQLFEMSEERVRASDIFAKDELGG